MVEQFDKPTRKMNRYNSKRYKKGLFWCWKCDGCIVGHGQKCSYCGALKSKKCLKKQDNLMQ